MPYLNDWAFYDGYLRQSSTRESAVLAAADAVALDVQNIPEAIVVRLANPLDATRTTPWLATVAVTIQNVNTTAQYVPDKVYRNKINEPDIVSTGQARWQYSPWEINRYVFHTLPPGGYAVVNNNFSYPCPDQNMRGFGCELFHSAYLTFQMPLVPGEYHNLLATAYAMPRAPL